MKVQFVKSVNKNFPGWNGMKSSDPRSLASFCFYYKTVSGTLYYRARLQSTWLRIWSKSIWVQVQNPLCTWWEILSKLLNLSEAVFHKTEILIILYQVGMVLAENNRESPIYNDLKKPDLIFLIKNKFRCMQLPTFFSDIVGDLQLLLFLSLCSTIFRT